MSGSQIERLLELIENNVSMTRNEAAAYLLKNKVEIARALASDGSAVIHTGAGSVRITRKDLERIVDSFHAAAA